VRSVLCKYLLMISDLSRVLDLNMSVNAGVIDVTLCCVLGNAAAADVS